MDDLSVVIVFNSAMVMLIRHWYAGKDVGELAKSSCSDKNADDENPQVVRKA